MAANTGIVVGGDMMVYRNTGTDVSPVWTPVAHATEHTKSTTTELRDRVTKTTGRWKSRKAGMNESTITTSSLTAYDGESYFSLKALQIAGTKMKLKYGGRPDADVTAGHAEVAEEAGDKYEEGYFYIQKIDRNDAANADSTMSVTFVSDGADEIKTAI